MKRKKSPKSQSRGQPKTRPIQANVWLGEQDQVFQQRADILMPVGNGNYQNTGKGGALAKTAPPPAVPLPAVPAPAIPRTKTKIKKAVQKTVKQPVQKTVKQPVKKVPNTAAGKSQALAEAVTSSFIDRFKAEANNKGGHLTIQDIENLSGEFTKNTAALKVAFEQSFEEYGNARERATMNLARDYPFDRLIVSQFAHIFKNDNELLKEKNTVSRRILPGFFMALNMMMGPEFAEDHQGKTRKIVARLSKGREMEFAWVELYDDKEAKELIFDTLVAMAFYFEDIKKRSGWFIKMMNDHMRQFEADAKPELRAWTFTSGAFKKFLKELFSDLKDTISSEGGRLMISKKYSVDTCVTLADILKQFE